MNEMNIGTLASGEIIGLLAIDEYNGTAQTVALFDDEKAWRSFIPSYRQKYPDHELQAARVLIDPLMDDLRRAATPKIIFTYCVEAQLDDWNVKIAVGAFTNKDAAKKFNEGWKEEYPEYPLVERKLPINPSKA